MRTALILTTVAALTGAVLSQPMKPVTTRLFDTSVPADWDEIPTNSAIYYIYPGKDVDPQKDNISITPSAISAGMGLDSYTYMAKFQIEREYPEVSLTTSKEFKLGTIPGHRFEYRGTKDGKKYLVIQVMALNGKNGYTIQYNGTEQNFNSIRNGFEGMLRNFKAK